MISASGYGPRAYYYYPPEAIEITGFHTIHELQVGAIGLFRSSFEEFLNRRGRWI
jgi:hypothetical protein